MDEQIKIYTDGGARGNPGPSASAFIVVSQGRVIEKGSSYNGVATNNQAEYRAVILALEWLTKNQPLWSKKRIDFFLDSELVAKQLSGDYKIKERHLKNLAVRAKELEKIITSKVRYLIVKREENKLADRLVNESIDRATS